MSEHDAGQWWSAETEERVAEAIKKAVHFDSRQAWSILFGPDMSASMSPDYGIAPRIARAALSAMPPSAFEITSWEDGKFIPYPEDDDMPPPATEPLEESNANVTGREWEALRGFREENDRLRAKVSRLQEQMLCMLDEDATEPLEAVLEKLERWATEYEVSYYATYFKPAIEDDNNYYRGDCPVDGKDAAAFGEAFTEIMEIIAAIRTAVDAARGGE